MSTSEGHAPVGRRPARPRGRRPAGEDTRAEILAAAQEHFAAVGYSGASMRAVARDAGVDPALVRHYFGGKSELFAAVMTTRDISPARVADRIVEGGRDGLAVRLVTEVLTLWDAPGAPERFRIVFATMATSAAQLDVLREFLTLEVLGRIGTTMTGDDVPLRLNLVLSQMLGLLVSRYALRVSPLDTAPVDVVAARVAPALQVYLEG